MTKKFITSALPYVNNQPHLGNVVGSVLGGDIYNRFCRKMGDETVYICGTDEYGTATEMEAVKMKVHPREIVEKNRILHKKVYDWFNIHFDFFGNTSCAEHTKLVQTIFNRCYQNGYFEKKEIEQFYCENCEQFLADRFVEGICGLCEYDGARGDQCDKCGKCLKTTDLKNPRCNICATTPVLKASNHLFLRLDLLQDKIKKVMDQKKDQWTECAINIYNEWLEKDLISRCMTRSLKYSWGVPVPLEGFEDKVFYVWFDAVIGYLTFLSIAKPDWEKWIKDAKMIQFMGKDNVFFHAFIFPGILLASDPSCRTVDVINSTEYLTFNKDKFSKSRKIGIFGMDLLEKDLGSPCIWRFYLTKRRPENKDSDFNIEDFVNTVNADLKDNLGNLAQRVLKYIKSRLSGRISNVSLDEKDEVFKNRVNEMFSEYKGLMEKISLKDGIHKAVEISSFVNKYIQDLQERKDRLENGFKIGYSALVLLGHIFEPFIPETSKKIFKMCGVEDSERFPSEFEIIQDAVISSEISILFPSLSKEQLSNLYSYVTDSIDLNKLKL